MRIMHLRACRTLYALCVCLDSLKLASVILYWRLPITMVFALARSLMNDS